MKNSARRRNFPFCLLGSFPQTPMIEDFIFGGAPVGTFLKFLMQLETVTLCRLIIDRYRDFEYNQDRQEVCAVLKIIGERLRTLRESVRLSQVKLAKEFGISQPSLARYETGDTITPPEVLLKFADYFDVSMDYIFGRTDNPKGTHYENHVNIGMSNPEMARFVEMCFDPGSAMNERLKETLVQMLSEVSEK